MPARRILAPALLLVVATGCGSATGDDDTLTVFAAASLTDAFTEVGAAYEEANPGVDVEFSFASSSDLARLVIEGAPVDVFASADTLNMDKVADAVSGSPVTFATNRAEIIVEPGNPLGIRGLDDLTSDDLVIVLCAPEAPCGGYAQEILGRAGVAITPDSLEENVRAVVTKVRLGEADAGIVYATDVLAVGTAADGVEIPADVNVVADYPVVDVSGIPSAAAFVEFLSGPVGRDLLDSYGFGSP